ncbi:SDR family oxidoreductase [Mycolicibacterium sp. 624]|uniref:SDR family NAD(P)-dependent oxidoreductase n=1 Tax=Mycolicibacterium sp. 624 TaxID=3156314 RepID=UPI003397C8A7
MNLDLTGRVALIAGGSKGIGRAIALEFAGLGASVAIGARGREALEETASEIGDVAGDPYVFQGDLCATASIEQMTDEVATHYGRIDILVNNVGDSIMGHDWRTGDDEWSAMLETSLMSTVRCSRAAIPHLLKSKYARIVNISSVNGHQPPAGRGDYNAAKAAVLAFSKTMANELAPTVTVNSICPARIDTPLWRRMAETMVDDSRTTVDSVLASVAKVDIPMGRFGMPEEVAALAAFLASDHGAWITGVAYNIDGGYTKAAV